MAPSIGAQLAARRGAASTSIYGERHIQTRPADIDHSCRTYSQPWPLSSPSSILCGASVMSAAVSSSADSAAVAVANSAATPIVGGTVPQAIAEADPALSAALIKEAINRSLNDAAAAPAMPVDDSFFATPAVDPSHPIVACMGELLHFIHDTTGLPWWATLFASGLIIRVGLAPLQIYQARISAGMSGLEPHFMVLDQKMRHAPKTFKTSLDIARIKWRMYTRHGCNPWKLLPPALVQIGAFVAMAISLRSMAISTPALQTGGMAWFENLAAMDPNYILPITAIAASYASSFAMEWHRKKEGERMKQKTIAILTKSPNAKPNAKVVIDVPPPVDAAPAAPTTAPSAPEQVSHLTEIQHYLRGLSLLTIPWVVHLPAGMFFFWFAGTLWTHVSSWLLRQSTVRDRLGFTHLENLLQRQVEERTNQIVPTPKPIVTQRATEKRKKTIAETIATPNLVKTKQN